MKEKGRGSGRERRRSEGVKERGRVGRRKESKEREKGIGREGRREGERR